MRNHILLVSSAVLAVALLGLLVAREPWQGGQEPVWTVPGGDPQRGRQLIVKYGCSACHVVAGIRQATGRVGPKLEDIDEQVYLAGLLPNLPDNMVEWIMNPRQISPQNAMPDLGVTGEDARDIAAHLYGQR